jgi:hypothetical protein
MQYQFNAPIFALTDRHQMTTSKIPKTREEFDALIADVRRSLENGREAVLNRMGYASYEEYRASHLWRKIKKRIFKQYEGKCFRCGGQASYVHHRCYTEQVLKGEDDEQLRPVCGGCHHVVEFDDSGQWRNEKDKERVLFDKAVRRDYPRPILDLRRKKAKVINPPNFQRMNSFQRQGWLHEFHFLAFTMQSPDLARTNPQAYARLKADYDETKEHGIDPPVGLKHRQKRKPK